MAKERLAGSRSATPGRAASAFGGAPSGRGGVRPGLAAPDLPGPRGPRARTGAGAPRAAVGLRAGDAGGRERIQLHRAGGSCARARRGDPRRRGDVGPVRLRPVAGGRVRGGPATCRASPSRWSWPGRPDPGPGLRKAGTRGQRRDGLGVRNRVDVAQRRGAADFEAGRLERRAGVGAGGRRGHRYADQGGRLGGVAQGQHPPTAVLGVAQHRVI